MKITNLKQQLVILFMLLTFSIPVYASEEPLDTVVAVVNSDVITASAVDKQLNIAKQQILAANAPMPSDAQLRQKVLNQLIDTKLLLQVAKKTNVTVSDDQVNQSIQQIAARNGLTTTQLQQRVVATHMSFADYRNEIRDEMLVSEVEQSEVSPHLKISDQEITDAMNSLKSQPKSEAATANPNAQYHLLDILIPLQDHADATLVSTAEHEANTLVAQLRKSSNAQGILNKNTSVHVADLGWRTFQQVPDLFSHVVETLAPGQYSNPIQAPNGFHILDLVAAAGLPSNPMAFQPGQLSQNEVKMILIKKNPLFTDNQMQVHLQSIRDQAVESGDFATVAEKNSQDADSASKGGDLGWINAGTLPLPVETAINQLKPGEISQPILSGDNYYIVQLTGRREDSDRALALHDQAREMVYQRKFAESLQRLIGVLHNQSYIKIN